MDATLVRHHRRYTVGTGEYLAFVVSLPGGRNRTRRRRQRTADEVYDESRAAHAADKNVSSRDDSDGPEIDPRPTQGDAEQIIATGLRNQTRFRSPRHRRFAVLAGAPPALLELLLAHLHRVNLTYVGGPKSIGIPMRGFANRRAKANALRVTAIGLKHRGCRALIMVLRWALSS